MADRAPTALAPIVSTDQILWQHRATRLLSRLLDDYAHLTPLSWTVWNAGCGLTGAISTLPPEVEIREAFTAWTDALGLTITSAYADEISTRLLATGQRDGVKLSLTATIYTEDRT
ncbi:hypothetical protein [Actinomadura alba]|uniref:SAM-dependent methyltransferase n=1 Tax=Actinomadura alba TaxID=406431 RepID=A0ABR7LI23_9ACTN|nr:hypothetical protein [Actinomadura alba]MBC6464234.1 hypothetical protein [Actinomadura alba]